MDTPLLELEGLECRMSVGRERWTLLEDVNLEVRRGEVVALVGESGSGKSLIAQAILALLPAGARLEGRIRFNGRVIYEGAGRDVRAALRGAAVGLVPQGSGTALHPMLRLGEQVAEVHRIHLRMPKREAWTAAAHRLAATGLEPGERWANAYPTECSGGARQRALVAMALAGQAPLLVADEPTKGIDALHRASICELLRTTVANQEGSALLLITHDLGVAHALAHRVGVVYAGRLVELRSASAFFRQPLHPYSQALLEALPERGLHPIAGLPPHPGHRLSGCAFEPRCPAPLPVCKTHVPKAAVDEHGLVRCHKYDH